MVSISAHDLRLAYEVREKLSLRPRDTRVQQTGGIISGSGAVVKNDAGAATVSGANTYSGGTTLNNGTLNANHATALGSGEDVTVACTQEAALFTEVAQKSIKFVNIRELGGWSGEKSTPKIAALIAMAALPETGDASVQRSTAFPVSRARPASTTASADG